MKKRILALFLALAIVLPLWFTAGAEGESYSFTTMNGHKSNGFYYIGEQSL